MIRSLANITLIASLACSPAIAIEDLDNLQVDASSDAAVETPGDAIEAADPGDEPVIDKHCNLHGYKSETQKFDPAVAIPDGNSGGVTVGPIQFVDDHTEIADVVVELQAGHTRIGDLIVKVLYDENCDGTTDATSVIMCRPGRSSCTTGSGNGCDKDLSCNKVYKFDDSANDRIGLKSSGSCQTSNPVASGCYKPTGSGATPLSVFKDRPKDGCWYLKVIDMTVGQKGSICEWTIHMLNDQGVGVEPQSWGVTKSLYR